MGGTRMSHFDRGFWESSKNSIQSNPFTEGLLKSIHLTISELELSGKIILSTSGTSSSPKLSVISKHAMLFSASSVNRHLSICSSDKWLCCLPTAHVSGLSIHARAFLSESDLIESTSKWAPLDFIKNINHNQITLCSLVPTQLYDLLSSDQRPNPELRALIIGGDKLNDEAHNKAVELGWPILLTYGMTETCSQIATETYTGQGMEPLDLWDINFNSEGELLVKGDALFDGYLVHKENNLRMIEPFSDDGWFSTGDIGNLHDNIISISGRKDDQVKVLGEKINLKHLRSSATSMYGHSITLLAVPDSRKGKKIIMVAEKSSDHDRFFNEYNSKATRIERADELILIDKIPRSSLGKLALNELYDILEKRIEA
ncbi:AMP-binding protein [Verrucomicrobiales bacterium]|nr:AMP-binding protein [Verrucomicrobiales bacterium]